MTCNKQKNQGGIPLMKAEYTISDSAPAVEWPVMRPVYLVKRIPNASPNVPPLTQLVCIGKDAPPDGVMPLAPGAERTPTRGTATVRFFDGPYDPLTFFGPVEVLDAKMNITKGAMLGGLGLGDVVHQWEE
jgi:hypothetical protein